MPPKVSVIIPVYNTAPYLRRCLDSVTGQTLRDIEIICVNDGSTDESGEILREYAGRDRRITLVDCLQNNGVSAARNAAVAIANGEYLGFVDSDDAIDPYFYEKLYAKAQETGAFIVKGVRQQITEDGTTVDEPLNDTVRRDKRTFTNQWTTAIYQTDFIRDNGITCPLNISNGEDTAFLLKAVYLASSVETVDDARYSYIRRSDSAHSAVFDYNRMVSVLNARKDVLTWLNEHAIPAEDYAHEYMTSIMSCRSLVRRAVSDSIHYLAACARAALEFYSLCNNKELLASRLAEKSPKLYTLLLSGDVGQLVEYYIPEKKTALRRLQIRVQARVALHAETKIRPKISVIIPAYETGPYLRRCLDSVCAQTLQDIEILCVNYASPDNTLEIMREYAAKDSRVRVHDFSRNRGVSAARNAAVAMARGEYLGFVASDDAIDFHFYEKLYAKACETGAVIVKGVRQNNFENNILKNSQSTY